MTRPGGRIVMGNWIPNDPTLVAQILKISSAYSPPPPEGFVSPMTWGVEEQRDRALRRRGRARGEDLVRAGHLHVQLSGHAGGVRGRVPDVLRADDERVRSCGKPTAATPSCRGAGRPSSTSRTRARAGMSPPFPQHSCACPRPPSQTEQRKGMGRFFVASGENPARRWTRGSGRASRPWYWRRWPRRRCSSSSGRSWWLSEPIWVRRSARSGRRDPSRRSSRLPCPLRSQTGSTPLVSHASSPSAARLRSPAARRLRARPRLPCFFSPTCWSGSPWPVCFRPDSRAPPPLRPSAVPGRSAGSRARTRSHGSSSRRSSAWLRPGARGGPPKRSPQSSRSRRLSPRAPPTRRRARRQPRSSERSSRTGPRGAGWWPRSPRTGRGRRC